MRQLRQAWAALGQPSGGGRFLHFYLPEDPDEAHQALVSLARGTGRTTATRRIDEDPGALPIRPRMA